MPSLSRITVYPIKSLDGRELSASKVLPVGALQEDRRYALVDSWGKYVNGKNCAAIHRLRATFSDDLRHITLEQDGQSKSFEIANEQEALADWCGEVLGKKCRLIENAEGGLPDDADSPGPTLVSTASLEVVANWFDGLSLDEVRRRMRFNFEVADTPAFWEDGLVAEVLKARRFRVGDLVWQGRGVCQRCVVPTRDSFDGTVTSGFAKEFARLRQATLPEWAPLARFDHYYRLGVNTSLESNDDGDVVSVGDCVELVT